MPKFYVSCGSNQMIAACEDAQQAAFKLIDDCLANHVWIYEDGQLSEQERRDHLVLEALLHLATSIEVSERGMGRKDAGSFEVPGLIDHWHKLMTSLSRVLADQGLDDQRVFPPAAKPSQTPRSPK